MRITSQISPQDNTVRFFSLEGTPSVLHPNKPYDFSNEHEANSANSPAIAGVFTRLKSIGIAPSLVRATALIQGEKKVDILGVKLSKAEQWGKADAVVVKMLERRLEQGGGIIITPNLSAHYSTVAEKDFDSIIAQIVPETVHIHNEKEAGRNAEDAIVVKTWSPKSGELQLALGEACGDPANTSSCSELARLATERTIARHLKASVNGITINIQ